MLLTGYQADEAEYKRTDDGSYIEVIFLDRQAGLFKRLIHGQSLLLF